MVSYNSFYKNFNTVGVSQGKSLNYLISKQFLIWFVANLVHIVICLLVVICFHK